jgi:hypothetical protein
MIPGQSRSDPSAVAATGSTDKLLAVYAAVAARRGDVDSRVWQVPALAMTAHAFLLTIALNTGGPRLPKVCAAILGLVLSGLSMQLMAKHRYLEVLDNRLLERIERDLAVDKILDYLPHARLSERMVDLKPAWSVRLSSYMLWMFGLLLFALTDVAAAVMSLT